MHTVNVTFSIPENINILLHSLIEKRGMSQFVSKTLEKALTEKKESLKAAYAAANQDPDRKSTIDEWETLDTEDWE
jgi:hypothetical protein